MTKVFIGGSRRVSRLNADVIERLDRIIEKHFPVLVGDADGADKAVQKHLQDRGYEQVEVFCSEGRCRNNVGGWNVRTVPVPAGTRGFDFYAAKDAQMAREATHGLMLWDGKSPGTLANVYRLVEGGKNVVVYSVPAREFSTLKTREDWNKFLDRCEPEVRDQLEKRLKPDGEKARRGKQASLFFANEASGPARQA